MKAPGHSSPFIFGYGKKEDDKKYGKTDKYKKWVHATCKVEQHP